VRVLPRFLLAATEPGRFPAPSLPEVAFLGRSNVGKSSLINSLLGTKIARTSSTPGRTRAINFFEIRWPGKPKPEMIFADLPGYGYARISREVAQSWAGFVEPYLNERTCLVLSLVLIDINVPSQESDQQLFRFLESAGRPFVIVATKSDRLSGNQLRNALERVRRENPRAQVLPYSARTGSGRDELWREIRATVAAHDQRDLREA
jgi:GTP-binding protein